MTGGGIKLVALTEPLRLESSPATATSKRSYVMSLASENMVRGVHDSGRFSTSLDAFSVSATAAS